MKKIICSFVALVLIGGIAYAEQQIDQGQTRGQAGSVSKFFVARNARGGTLISADRVVIWDTTSNDGITVTTTTNSFDSLVAGVTIDAIVGITSDSTAANSPGSSNWGRVRVYGRHAGVSWDSGSITCAAGYRVGTHSAAGEATVFVEVSEDSFATETTVLRTTRTASKDDFGVTLEACAAGNKTIDIFINKG